MKEEWLQKRPADGRHFYAYALAWRLSREALFWRMVRSIGLALGVGDLGEDFTTPPRTDGPITSDDPLLLFGLLELYKATRQRALLDRALRVAGNALARRLRNGFFVESPRHLFARVEDPTPLALLHLRQALVGSEGALPVYRGGRGFLHCPHDGFGRTYDRFVLYGRLRESSATP